MHVSIAFGVPYIHVYWYCFMLLMLFCLLYIIGISELILHIYSLHMLIYMWLNMYVEFTPSQIMTTRLIQKICANIVKFKSFLKNFY